jgi:hypothetical protein
LPGQPVGGGQRTFQLYELFLLYSSDIIERERGFKIDFVNDFGCEAFDFGCEAFDFVRIRNELSKINYFTN